jgi:DNA-binding IclR family transcriptional regulator
MPLGELARELELDKAALYRTLATLKARNYADQDEATGYYRLGRAPLALADAYLSHDTLRSTLHNVAAEASSRAGELCHVGVPDGVKVRYIDKVEPERAIRVYSHVGIRNPLETTALGRAILAVETSSDEQVNSRIGLEHSTSRVLEAVRQARERGFAEEIEENEDGITCVAVAVERAGIAEAAISITAPAERMTEERRSELAALLRDCLESSLPPGLRPQAVAFSAA